VEGDVGGWWAGYADRERGDLWEDRGEAVEVCLGEAGEAGRKGCCRVVDSLMTPNVLSRHPQGQGRWRGFVLRVGYTAHHLREPIAHA
jgi:hypothetical protein